MLCSPFFRSHQPSPAKLPAKSFRFQVKGPLDTSNFDDFSGVDERFAIHKERHKACWVGRGVSSHSHIFRDSYGYHKGVPLLGVPENSTDFNSELISISGIPSLKLKIMIGIHYYFPFGARPIFRAEHVSFRECNFF